MMICNVFKVSYNDISILDGFGNNKCKLYIEKRNTERTYDNNLDITSLCFAKRIIEISGVDKPIDVWCFPANAVFKITIGRFYSKINNNENESRHSMKRGSNNEVSYQMDIDAIMTNFIYNTNGVSGEWCWSFAEL